MFDIDVFLSCLVNSEQNKINYEKKIILFLIYILLSNLHV